MAKRTRQKQQADQPSLQDLPANVRLSVEPDRLEIVYTSKRWVLGTSVAGFGFLVASFLVQIIPEAIQRGMPASDTLGLSLISLVLLFLFCVALRCFLHREKLRIDENGLDWRFSCLLPVRRKKIPWSDLAAINVGMGDGDQRQFIRGWGIEIETNSKACLIFLDMPYFSYLSIFLTVFYGCLMGGVNRGTPCFNESNMISKIERKL